MQRDVNAPASVTFEPSMTYRVLKGCRNCHQAHPLARKPPKPADVCPDCGFPALPPGPIKVADTALTDKSFAGRIGRFFLWLGRAVHDIAKRL